MKYLVIIALIVFFYLFHKIRTKTEFAIFWELSSLYRSLVSLFISEDVGLSTSSSGYCSTPSGSGSKQLHIQSSQDWSVSSQASELQSGGYSRDEQQRKPEQQQIRRRITSKIQTRSSTNECDR